MVDEGIDGPSSDELEEKYVTRAELDEKLESLERRLDRKIIVSTAISTAFLSALIIGVGFVLSRAKQ